MADGNVYLHPALERSQLRRKMAAAVDQLLDAVELLVRQLDDGAPDPDLEPNLGAPETNLFLWNIGAQGPCFEAMAWARGSGDEEEMDPDLEPSLATMQRRSRHDVSQLAWERTGGGPWTDTEQEHDGREPTLGAPEPTTAGNLDQRRWAQGGDGGERELVSEDEGAQCDDEGAETFHEVYDYPLDQRVAFAGDGQAIDTSSGAR